ncbi:dTDP-4-dehydrorhamnose reductase [Vibrio rumoiensis]|uniref:dTDP-4-dehydrorhamnose reductase n=1 Tax=Vibrio rumoiensis TaxID=76258 RepID=UPI0037490E8A
MKVLITGGGGQVAKVLVKQLGHKHHLTCFDKSEFDITSEESLVRGLSLTKPDVVINTAAYTAVDKAESEPDLAFDVNGEGVRKLASACNRFDCVLIHLSTDYVYDGHTEGFHSENEETNPQTVYGKSKLLGENYIQQSCKKYLIIRTSWLFSEYGNNFLKTIFKLLDTGNSVSVVNDQFGSPTSCYNLACFIDEILFTLETKLIDDIWGIYNYSDSPATNWYHFSMEIEKAMNKSTTSKIIPIPSIDYSSPADRPKNSKLSCSKILRVFGSKSRSWKGEVEVLVKKLLKGTK